MAVKKQKTKRVRDTLHQEIVEALIEYWADVDRQQVVDLLEDIVESEGDNASAAQAMLQEDLDVFNAFHDEVQDIMNRAKRAALKALKGRTR